jgi:hypothetical protein
MGELALGEERRDHFAAVQVLADGEHPHAFAQLAGEIVEQRHLGHARHAPGGPQVDQHRRALELARGERRARRVAQLDGGHRRAGEAAVDRAGQLLAARRGGFRLRGILALPIAPGRNEGERAGER